MSHPGKKCVLGKGNWPRIGLPHVLLSAIALSLLPSRAQMPQDAPMPENPVAFPEPDASSVFERWQQGLGITAVALILIGIVGLVRARRADETQASPITTFISALMLLAGTVLGVVLLIV